jgi:NarL family two-component system response regulator LiaR
MTQTLTATEKQVVVLITKGFSNKDIAEELCISVSTVKSHIENIYEKLDVHNRVQATIVAIKEGLITL